MKSNSELLNEIFCDNFDTYNVGQQLVVQNSSDWTTWSNNPGSAEDPYIVNTYSNSVEITGSNDLVHQLPNYTNGKYLISFDVYIPVGCDGYFNTLQEFNGSSSSWGMQVYFGETNPGEGNIDAGGPLVQTFTFGYNTWINVEVMVDLDNDWAEFYLNNELIHDWQWSTGAFGTNNLNQLGGSNFFAWPDGVQSNPLFEVDNFCVYNLDFEPEPVLNISATPNQYDVLVGWDPPLGTGDYVQLSQHNGNPQNGFYQNYENGYGVVFDVSEYPGSTLEFIDFYHISWDVSGTWDYSIHIVNWNTYIEISETDVMQTTGDDTWENLVPIGSIEGQSGLVGIFLEPMSYDSTDAYPCLAGDNVGPGGLSYFGPIDDYGTMTLSIIGDFLLDLWIMTDAGKWVNISPVIVEADQVNNLGETHLPVVSAPESEYKLQQQSINKSVETLSGYNIYRNDEFQAFVNIPETDYLDENLGAGTYTYCVTAVYLEGESSELCADPVTIEYGYPFPPSNLTAEANGEDINLAWDEPDDYKKNKCQGIKSSIPQNLSEITGYNIYYKHANEPYIFLDYVSNNMYTHLEAGLLYGQHCYKVSAIYEPQGESGTTNEACEFIDQIREIDDHTIQIFPNPSIDKLTIQSVIPIISISLYNFAGQKILFEAVHKTTLSIHTNEFQKGVYFLRIITQNEELSQRVIFE
ncbi:MAG: T9SS type A sorting domain-containing protein [Bacteroidales bacterium]|nr:T9SS type A sorting domain-containing protein [Bacteroidales bacterium]